MEGFVGRRDLLRPDELKALSERSDLPDALQLGSHAAALAATGGLIGVTWGSWWVVALLLLHGILLNWLYCAQHELSHGTVFRTRWLNMAAGRAIGFLQLYPRDFDQMQHFGHHRHTGDWQRDPELQRDPYELPGYIFWFTGISYWHSRISRLLRLTFGTVVEPYIREDEKPRVIREARWHLAFYGLVGVASVALESWAVVVYWLAPMLLTKWSYMLQGTIKHLGRPHSANLFDNTRTARTGPLFHWLGWNMQYHTAHHLFPSVPFYRLAPLHRAIVERIGKEPPTMGYFEFQRQTLRRLARGRERADYTDDVAWIEPSRPEVN